MLLSVLTDRSRKVPEVLEGIQLVSIIVISRASTTLLGTLFTTCFISFSRKGWLLTKRDIGNLPIKGVSQLILLVKHSLSQGSNDIEFLSAPPSLRGNATKTGGNEAFVLHSF